MAGIRFVAPVLALALSAAACADRPPLAPSAPSARLARADKTLINGIWEVRSVTGEGALYGLFVPENWNGSLVLWGHGIVDWKLPLALEPNPAIPSLRAGLNGLGYAVAYSSYSYNGWNVSDAAERTHQLVGLFTSQFSRPTRVYLTGVSMGAVAALKLAETHPDEYVGVLARNGELGGGQAMADHYWNVRLLFDLYYPGKLPGSGLEWSGLSNDEFLPLAQQAMENDSMGAVHIAEAMAAIGMPLAIVPGSEPASRKNSILTALGQLNGGWEMIMARTHGHIPFDNVLTDYVIPEVQDGIARIAGDSDALAYFQRNYQPTGQLRVPLVTLDNAWDPVAPAFHRDQYQELLSHTGAADLMYRITLPLNSHALQPVSAMLAAFQKLTAWVETGQRP